MKRKGISKLTKLKIMFYSFLILPFIVVACSIITHFVGNVTKYWLDFIISNYSSLLIFFVLITTGVILLFTNEKRKIIGIIIMIIVIPVWWLIFSNTALPLDRDLYVMITKSYSHVNGPVVASRVKHNKNSTDTELTIYDIKQNKNITVIFFDQSSSVFRVGDNINVTYLPHSHMGLSYFHENQSFINKNPFSLLQPSIQSKIPQTTRPSTN